MKNLLSQFVWDDSAQDLIEYALLATMVSLASIAVISILGGLIGGKFSNVAASLGPGLGSVP